MYLDSTTDKLSGDIVLIAILALSRSKILNHAHFYLDFYLARTGFLHSNNCGIFPIEHTTPLQGFF